MKCEPAGYHNAIIIVHINNDTIKHNPVTVEYRELRTIDIHAFNEDIITKLGEPEKEATCEQLLDVHESIKFYCQIFLINMSGNQAVYTFLMGHCGGDV